jgi:hypothetical protein
MTHTLREFFTRYSRRNWLIRMWQQFNKFFLRLSLYNKMFLYNLGGNKKWERIHHL